MEPIFSLGIRSLWNELNHMPAGGVWWLNVESQGDAINLVNQTVAAQQPEAKVAVVSMSAKLKQAIKLDSAEGPEKIRLFYYAFVHQWAQCAAPRFDVQH